MEIFEAKLAQATAPETQDILGAIGLAVNRRGNIVYHHASGRQSLDANAPPLDPNSTVVLASAGKFITNIAALQLVEYGAIKLDEPVYQYLPELESLPLIRRGVDGETLTVCPPARKITLRHLLLNTSGLSGHDVTLVSDYFASDCAKPQYKDDAPFIVKNFSIPLIFEPGEGFVYGYSIHWVQLMVSRVTGDFLKYIQEHIFSPLGMASSTYRPRDNSEIWNKRLRMVEREGNTLVPADDVSQGLTCSMKDMAAILGDLISPSPKLLKEHTEILMTGQFAPSSTALKQLCNDSENYAFCAGKLDGTDAPSVNWSAGGLVVNAELSLSHMPKGTVTWEGMPNVLWAMNREKGLALLFATQLIPVGDRIVNELAMAFMRDAWNKFG